MKNENGQKRDEGGRYSALIRSEAIMNTPESITEMSEYLRRKVRHVWEE